MSDESTNQNLIVGAAVVAGILGTVSALIHSNKAVQGWTEQAREVAGDTVNKNMLLGGVAGGLIGAAAALLLAPKAGSELIKDITRTLKHPGDLVHSASHKTTSSKSARKAPSRSKGASSSKQGKPKEEPKSEGSHPSRKSPSKKKPSPPRRRTASAALKAAAPEKESSEEADQA